ncbi:MAG: UvrD-helicase domain-containing protein, partial [Muribaculaceae bacterium]|nr:UvrD-helicase domain-containing protein [Muribaculaceae bacterium]
MLQLQRASAGSGKTFTLAKKFIWFLIAIKEDGKPWRLRNPREIADGLGRILAITFTNKATNEMKQRIVAKLADLSRAADEPVTPELLASVAYLKDFASDLDTSPRNIGIACKAALSALLNDYSAFRVSTIDSFFQSIL